LKLNVYEEMAEDANRELQSALKMKKTSKQCSVFLEKASEKLEQSINGKKGSQQAFKPLKKNWNH
jgi:hypothetical protein